MTNPLFLYCIGGVLAAVILMTVLLKAFPAFFGLRSARGGRAAAEQAPRVPGTSLSGIIAQNPDHDGEIVAAIMAAIAAARGPYAGAFRIASMNPSQSSDGFNTPAWGHIDRFVR